jgi:hypothetical protein
MQLSEKQVISRIRAHGRGFVFTPKLFSSVTNDSGSIRTALTRLVQKNAIRRLAHGLYDLPEIHEKLGPIMPTTEKVIEAIKTCEAIEIPMKIELYTNGPKKTIRFGKQVIVLKPTTPKNMIGAGTKAGLILHALRQIGKENITQEMISHIKNQLVDKDLKHIKKQALYAPIWIAKIMRELIDEK